MVQGSGFRVQGPGFRVQGLGFRVQGLGFRVQGLGFRVCSGHPPLRRTRMLQLERCGPMDGGLLASALRDVIQHPLQSLHPKYRQTTNYKQVDYSLKLG